MAEQNPSAIDDDANWGRPWLHSAMHRNATEQFAPGSTKLVPQATMHHDATPTQPSAPGSIDSIAPATTAAPTEASDSQGYCLPPTTTDSLNPNHRWYQPHGTIQPKTVMADLLGEFDAKTGTLQISVVAFYPFDYMKNKSLGWEKFENKSAAITAINHALHTVNPSLYIRLAHEGAARILTSLGKEKHTVGGGLMRFLNSMISQHNVNTFELNDAEKTVCRILFREGTWEGPDAASGNDNNTNTLDGLGPWLAPYGGSLVLDPVHLSNALELISRGPDNVKVPKKIPNCVIGTVPMWTAGKKAQ
jgi:hypothetical protein